MTKKGLRLSFRNKRGLLTFPLIEGYSIDIANRALELPIWNFLHFHIFLPIEKNKEVSTLPLLSILQGKDKNIIVPKIVAKNQLEHYLLTDNTTLLPNYLGIPEPVDGIGVPEHKLDVVFVPLLAFDIHGNRVGYGKGFYDGFLRKCRKDVVKIGLSFFEASDSIDDIHEGDIPLDYCITPEKTYRF